MSLTSELAGGPLADWFTARFPGTRFAAALRGELIGLAAVRPRSHVGRGHWATVGGAFGTRLAWAVEPAPPYYALYGAHNAGLVGWDDVNRAAAIFATHRPEADRPPWDAAGDPLTWRPTPSGWIDTAAPAGQQPARRQDGTHPTVVGGFTSRAAMFLDRVPPGGFGTTGEETVLARIALVLGDWEQAYRRGPDALPHAARAALERAAAEGDPAALLAAVDPAALADTTALISHARRHGLLDQLADTAGAALPHGHAFPVFAEQWADGDLLLDPGNGAATTLIDVKTVMSARDPSTVRRWLWQLLGYAYLADLAAPEWRLGRVGLCFARHAHVISWDIDELAGLLAADHDGSRGGGGSIGAFASERAGFRAAFTTTLAARGLQAG